MPGGRTKARITVAIAPVLARALDGQAKSGGITRSAAVEETVSEWLRSRIEGMSRVGSEIRRLREGKGWTGAQLAVYAGMAPSAVSQIETGKRNPNTGSLAKIAEALGVEVADLFPKAQAPLPLEEGKLMDRSEVQAWLREQGHLDRVEFLSWAEDLEFEIDDEGIPEGIERGIQEVREMRDKLDKAVTTPPVRDALFPRREVPEGAKIKELFRRTGLARKLKWEIRSEYLAREVALTKYSRQLYIEGKTSDYLVYGPPSEHHHERHRMLEEERRRILEESYAKAVA
jgi:transcriptional regulator with XRE-family HTH domain